MNKSDLELFKQALSEGLSESFDSVVDGYTGEVVCSKRHELAMRTIVYGKTSERRILSPKERRIIAILIAIALLLTSCATVFRNELRELFREFYVAITLSDNVSGENFIEEVYELSYVPEGFYLEKSSISTLSTNYIFYNDSDEIIRFIQGILDGAKFTIDIENGYAKMLEINGYDVYFRDTTHFKNYLWTDGKYSLLLKTNAEIPSSEIIRIIEGITVQ